VFSLPQMEGQLFIMGTKQFLKPSLGISEQIELLKKRGLVITDNDAAYSLLSNNNYYRLEGYWYPFYIETDNEEHVFKKDVSLDSVVNLYEFDKKLRNLVFKAISDIEISFRAQFAYQLAIQYGAFPFDDPNCFKYRNAEDKATSIKRLEDEYNYSKEEFIEHFRKNYAEHLPPIWMMVEIMTFGEISAWYEFHATEPTKKAIAKYYGFRDSSVFASWIRQLSIVRNVCAHHARLWNKIISITPAFPKKLDIQEYVDLFVTANDKYSSPRRLYNILLIMQYLLCKIGLEKTHFLEDVRDITSEHNINLERMGFPQNITFSDILQKLTNR